MQPLPMPRRFISSRSCPRRTGLFVVLTLMLLGGAAWQSQAQAAAWDHSAAKPCFERWGAIAATRLNDYVTGGGKRATPLYRFNAFGEVVSTRVAVQVEPGINYYEYDNKFHWMWMHYYDGPYGWKNTLWRDAGVPPLRTFVRYCVRKYDENHWTRMTVKSLGATAQTLMSLDKYLHMPASRGRSKKMITNPVYRGYRLSRCYGEGYECTGMKAAYHFCRARGFAGVDDYRLRRAVGPTRYMSNSQLCRSTGCDGFAWVRCAGTQSRGMQRLGFL